MDEFLQKHLEDSKKSPKISRRNTQKNPKKDSFKETSGGFPKQKRNSWKISTRKYWRNFTKSYCRIPSKKFWKKSRRNSRRAPRSNYLRIFERNCWKFSRSSIVGKLQEETCQGLSKKLLEKKIKSNSQRILIINFWRFPEKILGGFTEGTSEGFPE